MIYGTGRGHKYHAIRKTTLDNQQMLSMCGCNIDQRVSLMGAGPFNLCGNCTRTKEYANDAR